MNLEKVEQLIKLVKSNEVKKFTYKDFEHEISIDFTEGVANNVVSNQPSNQSSEAYSNDTSNGETNESSYQSVKSPMVGTFFLQDEKELTNPIVKVGDEIKKGDTIGYIEAMKVLNEVVSDVSGVVDEILVEHGSNVEYNQQIIRVK
ncbi:MULTISPECIES: acetyl-CoA carboxylase biotin carboxyl carrier protein [Staphylococcus]|uniref:Acetyl-CoA carboxylase biotin carboxyl carrier protein subunit n=1 Tax=Staphylococcus xylosus TaxID=1288 RepID=A0A418ILC9_STAXY|nr:MULTISPECIES: biotin/lipoyl-containing protein [Staphylococcus]MDW8542323.1 biotin/lipoyl-containing protein [Staphylococcus sp. KG4-1]MRF37799.1 acetyl-CoA carboxylase biotin carboxyl carrier protein subunit [Staphylococcus sp. KY49P]MDW8561691.1 biotin/lipoyl-containing protein [Staphylococcus sp. KG4-3]NQD98209.1 acetyl-CoA carboxylase biotin carboxyl carrier protein subunit [Staphylococcus xylosus]PTI10734.1 acetyl-CoA carboxylase biotin carboxyl carrier protein subunit [Staphylococcus 